MYDNPTKGFNSLATLRDQYRTFGKGAYLTGGGLDVTGTAAGLTFNK